MLRVLMLLVPLALAIYALVDCISSKDEEVKHLPKLVWLALIVLAWVIGPLAWIFLGRERSVPGRGAAAAGRGSRSGAGGGWVAPDDNPEFLRSLNDEREHEANQQDKELLESWEEDLRRREEELRRRDSDDGGPKDNPSA